MHTTPGDRYRTRRAKTGPARLVRLCAEESSTADLLSGCPVVTAAGQRIGRVDHLMVDAFTHQLRYIVLSHRKSRAAVAIPWHSLYFDAAQGKLVFYTLT